MKSIFLLVLVGAGLFGVACERHSASTLPAHGGGHAEAAHPVAAKTGEKPAEAKPAAPEKGAPAAKFFDQQPK